MAPESTTRDLPSLTSVARVHRAKVAKAIEAPSIVVCTASTRSPQGIVRNLGDEVLTVDLVEAIRERWPEARVTATLGGPGCDVPGRFNPRSLRRLGREVSGADLVVMGGGTLLQEDIQPSSFGLPAGMPRYLAAVATVCRLAGTPWIIAGVGAEGVPSKASHMLLRTAISGATSVSVRDARTQGAVADLYGRRPLLAADAVFLRQCGRLEGRVADDSILINLTKTVDPAVLSGLETWLARRPVGTPVRMIITENSGGDERTMRSFAHRLDGNVAIIRPLTGADLRSCLGKASVCIGARLHFVLLAGLAGARVAPIATNPKTEALCDALGISTLPVFETGSNPGVYMTAAWLKQQRRSAQVILDQIAGALG